MKAKVLYIDEELAKALTANARKERAYYLHRLREEEFHTHFYKQFRTEYVTMYRWLHSGLGIQQVRSNNRV